MALSRGTGVVELPAGALTLHRELTLPAGAHDLEIRGNAAGSTLQAASDFQGRALLVAEGGKALKFRNFSIDGNRAALEKRIGLPPADVPFARFYPNNGILVEHSSQVTVENIYFSHVSNLALLVNASSVVRITGVRVEDSGSLNPAGKNNATGGILLEEGTTDFTVRDCELRRIRGNAIWTHSNYGSPRNADGTIEHNQVEVVARDAIQVGHATRVRVEQNTGARIGYPVELVDILAYAVPVALDTAGNVDRSVYRGNQFDEIDGQCIDLDGFHDGEVRDNSCVSRKGFDEYPYAQYGIVFGNSNPDAKPENVTVAGNVIDGAGYGGLFLIGSRHMVTGNRFVNLNRNKCTGDMTQVRCNYAAEQPDLLRSCIYLAHGAARPAETIGNRIAQNEISGFGADRWCITAAPGVKLAANQITGNRCTGAQPE
ncbi:MAG: right-handed parallel beta-helix repeat-containing protein [Bryobacteraceae bacterium]